MCDKLPWRLRDTAVLKQVACLLLLVCEIFSGYYSRGGIL